MKPEAIINLYPQDTRVDGDGDAAIAFDVNGNRVTIDEAAVQAEITRLEVDYAANQYQRQRVTEYPSLADFADAYYWAQKGDNTLMDAYIAKCDAVKTKYSKV